MQLNVFIHNRLAATAEANPDRHRELHVLPFATHLSALTTPDTPPRRIIDWLDCVLPENTMLDSWANETTAIMQRAAGIREDIRIPESILWALCDAEYPGAVTFSRDSQQPLASTTPAKRYPRMGSEEIRDHLQKTHWASRTGSGQRPYPTQSPKSSLSGMRPKTSLTLDTDGITWRCAPPGHLNTWVVKIEDAADNPAQAGNESICQNALREMGIRAAETRTAVLSGHQCVLSRRTDRLMQDGLVTPIHQEDMRQATGARKRLKFRSGTWEEPYWPEAYAVLQHKAQDPDGECAELTRLLAAAVLMAHGDLHRANLGYNIHPAGDGGKHVTLAPAYDFASTLNTPYQTDMILPIGERIKVAEITASDWVEHARKCNLDADATLDAVTDVARRLPDAIAVARDECAQRDENRSQRVVNERTEGLIAHASILGSALLSQRGRLRVSKRNARRSQRQNGP